MSGPNCLSLHAAEARPISAIKAKPWSASKTNFSFSPNAVIPTAPAIIANKGRQHGAARAIKRAPTDPIPSSKATVRVRRLVLISRKVSQSQQSRPRSEECQQWPTPTLDKRSDNSSLCLCPRQVSQPLRLKHRTRLQSGHAVSVSIVSSSLRAYP